MSEEYLTRTVNTCKYELTYTQGVLRGTFVIDSIKNKIRRGEIIKSSSNSAQIEIFEDLYASIPLLDSAKKSKIANDLEQASQQAHRHGCQFNALLTMQQSKIDFGDKINRTGTSLARLSIYDSKKEYHYIDIPIDDSSSEISNAVEKMLQKSNSNATQYRGKIKPDCVFILLPQAAGFFIHEILGHLLEKDLTFSSKPVYSIKDYGKRVFSQNISLFDDPFDMQGINFGICDDLGYTLNKKCLIKDGIFIDMISSLRSDSYYKQPKCRMYNLCLSGGSIGSSEILKRYPDGLLIEDIIAGEVNPYNGEFLLFCNRAYYREHQEIKGRISNFCIRGSAYNMGKYIIEVGKETSAFIGYCSKHLQTIPVGNKTPTLVLCNVKFHQI